MACAMSAMRARTSAAAAGSLPRRLHLAPAQPCASNASVRRGRPVRFRQGDKAAQEQQQQQADSDAAPVPVEKTAPQPVEAKVEATVAQTTEKVANHVEGFLSDPNSQAQCFWYLGTAALTTSLLCLLAPGRLASLMLNSTPDSVVNTLVRAAGAALVTSATVKYTLKEASVREQLHLDTFRRLNLGLVLQTGATLVVAAQAVSLRNNLLTGYMALVCAPGLLLASRLYALYKRGGGLPLPSPTKTLAAVVGLLLPRNLAAAAYSVLTVAFAGMAALCLAATPGQPLTFYQGLHGPMSVFAERCAGAALLLMTLVAYSLKDGADRGKLGAMTFRWLNLGLAGSLMSMVWCFTGDYEAGLLVHTSQSVAMMAGILASFMFCGFMYVAGTSTPNTNQATKAA